MSIQFNGGGLSQHKGAPRLKRAAARRPKAVESPILTIAAMWPGIAAVGALIMSLISYLNSNGFIDPVAHKNEVANVASDVATVKDALKKNDTDHSVMQSDIKSVLSTLGRMEGRQLSGGKSR